MHDIAPAELEGIDVTVKLANRDTISPVGIIRDVEVLCGKVNILLIFLFLIPHKMTFLGLYLAHPSSTFLMLREIGKTILLLFV